MYLCILIPLDFRCFLLFLVSFRSRRKPRPRVGRRLRTVQKRPPPGLLSPAAAQCQRTLKTPGKAHGQSKEAKVWMPLLPLLGPRATRASKWFVHPPCELRQRCVLEHIWWFALAKELLWLLHFVAYLCVILCLSMHIYAIYKYAAVWCSMMQYAYLILSQKLSFRILIESCYFMAVKAWQVSNGRAKARQHEGGLRRLGIEQIACTGAEMSKTGWTRQEDSRDEDSRMSDDSRGGGQRWSKHFNALFLRFPLKPRVWLQQRLVDNSLNRSACTPVKGTPIVKLKK